MHSVQFSSVAQSCPTLCNPIDCSLPGFPVKNKIPRNKPNQILRNYETLTKETEEDPNRWKDIPHSWIGGLNIVKMIILSKAIG